MAAHTFVTRVTVERGSSTKMAGLMEAGQLRFAIRNGCYWVVGTAVGSVFFVSNERPSGRIILLMKPPGVPSRFG